MSQIKTIQERFLERKMTLAGAESCTGGLLLNMVTDRPGSSAYVAGGIIAYSNAVKHKVLGVPPSILAKHGAVSEQTAIRMAKGVRKLLKATIGVGITGIAGPGGATTTKPVGLTFIAVADAKHTVCRSFIFKGSRTANKKQAAHAALTMLSEFIHA